MRRTRRNFTNEEIKIIKDNFGILSTKDIADKLDRPVSTIKNKAWRLGFKYSDLEIPTNPLSETEKAYIAGLVDGEGYIGVQTIQKDNTPHHVTANFQIANNSKEIIEWLSTKIGFGNRWNIKKSIHHRVETRYGEERFYYHFGFNGIQRIKSFLKVIFPYLIIKRSVAKYMIEYLTYHQVGKYNKKDWQLILKIYESNAINKKESVIITNKIRKHILSFS